MQITEIFTNKLINKDKATLAQALSIVESISKRYTNTRRELLTFCSKHIGNSLKIGITGVPGSGKSTFINALGYYLTQQGHWVAVLSVDPSSVISGGSILGDKTRMEALSRSKNAFIRPQPSRTLMGGMTYAIMEQIMVFETAGYDIIFLETVGVGQQETDVFNLADFCLLLLLTDSGDELQSSKRGIMELADAYIIHKADGDNITPAKRMLSQLKQTITMLSHEKHKPIFDMASSLNDANHSQLWKKIIRQIDAKKKDGTFEQHRQEQKKQWLIQHLKNYLYLHFFNHPTMQHALDSAIDDIKNNHMDGIWQLEEKIENLKKHI